MEIDKKYLQTRLKNVNRIKKIRGEASSRSFYRLFFDNYSLMAMVFPGENQEEIDKILKLTGTYLKHNLKVPTIKDIIDHRIILQDDLGNLLAQKAFAVLNKEERKKILEKTADILMRLKGVPTSQTDSTLDTARMKWEMDFFLTHFVLNYFKVVESAEAFKELRDRLHRMVDLIKPIDTFAHRDFHSRNMLIYKSDIYLVDFQDSLQAPHLYDLVSFAYDSYLDLRTQREILLDCLKERGMIIDEEQFYITALQRNIKALGTFGYQVKVKKNLTYRKYIRRTLEHIFANPLFSKFLTLPFFLIHKNA